MYQLIPRLGTATDGPSALARATREHPDVVVLDLELPGKSGIEVATILRAQPTTCDIPLIAATGYSHAEQLDLARRAGFDAIVIKPCDPEDLVGQIRRFLPPDEAADDPVEGHVATK